MRRRKSNRLSEAHSLPGDGRGKDLSGKGKKQTERGLLTLWRRKRKGLVRTREKNRPIEAHSLPGDGKGTCQDMKSNQQSEAHSLSGDGRGRYLSGYEKETERETPTHILETAEGVNDQET